MVLDGGPSSPQSIVDLKQHKDEAEVLEDQENQQSFDSWKAGIEGVELKPENLCAYLDVLDKIPLLDYPQQSSEFLIDFLARAREDNPAFSSSMDYESLHKRIEDNSLWMDIEEEGYESFFLYHIYNLIEKKLDKIDNSKELDRGRIDLVLTLFRRILEDFNSLYESADGSDNEDLGDSENDVEDRYMDEFSSDIPNNEKDFDWAFTMDEGVFDEEVSYNYLKKIIFLCKKFKIKESLSELYKVADSDPSLIFIRELADAFSEIDPNKAAIEMLKRLKNSERDINRAYYSKILYLMEFGKIEVEDGNVKYLERVFRLQGEQKEEIQVAFRITGDGKIGLFDEEENLIGYFELGELFKEEQEPIRQIIDNFEQLALANPDTDPKIIDNFKKDYLQVYKDFHDETNVRFSDLRVREQVWFYQYLQEAGKDKQVKAKQLAKKFGREGIKAFISLELDKNAGDSIFAIAENFDDEIAQAVFKKYSDLVDSTEGVAKYLKDNFGSDGDDQLVGEITRGLLNRGKDLLVEFARESKKLGVDEQKNNCDEVLDKLKNSKVDIILFTQAFKTARPELSEVKGMELARFDVSELSEGDKKEMLEISKANWLDRGSAGEGVVAEFEEALNTGQDIDFHVLRKDGKVISFMRFEPVKDEAGEVVPNHKYAGSFNVDPNYRGSAIGKAMIEETLNYEADRHVLEATVHPGISVGTRYVEDTGFAITKTLPNYDNSGITFFEIVCDRKKNKLLESRNMEKEQVLELYEAQQGQSTDDLLQTEENIVVRRFDPKIENEQVLDAVDSFASVGYIVARYFTDSKDNSKRYYVFEKDKQIEAESRNEAYAEAA